jgi:hypothetical protein
MSTRILALTLGLSMAALGVSCSSADGPSTATSSTSEAAATPTTAASTDTTTAETAGTGQPVTFTAEVWADNWFSLSVNGETVGEDSVPITTERSFNSETLTFEATYPLTIAMVTKDFKETDSGLEYIGTDRQQMGDGGFIAQITDTTTGAIVAVTDDTWRALVIQRAPLNTDCESSDDPDTDCESEATDEPEGWTETDFDDADWAAATVYTAAEVDPKEGYSDVAWDPAAQFLWGSDLEVDNTVLWRATVDAP